MLFPFPYLPENRRSQKLIPQNFGKLLNREIKFNEIRRF